MAKIDDEVVKINDPGAEMANYSDRARKAAEEKPKEIKRMAKGVATVKPKKGLSKMKAVFTSETISDTFLPVVKKAAYDILKDTIEMAIFGEVRRDGRSRRSSSQYVSYRDYSDRDKDRDRDRARDTRRGIQLDDIYLRSRVEAEELIEAMDDIIYKHGSASVFDLYDIIGADTMHTDNKYGWYSVRGFRVTSTRDGYRLDTPKPQPL